MIHSWINLLDAAVQNHQQQSNVKPRFEGSDFVCQSFHPNHVNDGFPLAFVCAGLPNEGFAGSTITMVDHDDLADTVQFAGQFDVLPECLGLCAGLIRHHANGPASQNDLVITAPKTAPVKVCGDRRDQTIVHAIEGQGLGCMVPFLCSICLKV